jgi:Holliday junction resolvasome RuvABC endonuclease subunit
VKALGIDVGFAKLGWALADVSDPQHPRSLAVGLIRTEKDKRKVLAASDNHKRAQHIVRELAIVLDGHPSIGVICAETISFVRSAAVMSQIGRAWGILDALAEARRLPLLQASPQEIKAACCPFVKNASKDDVIHAVTARFGAETLAHLSPIPASMREHPADALGAIWACLQRDELRLYARALGGAA